MSATRVRQAAAWMDVRYPGWEAKVDLDNFNLGQGKRCIGGHVLGTTNGWITLRHGFYKDTGLPDDAIFADRDLEGAWREEILNRRTREAAEPLPEFITA